MSISRTVQGKCAQCGYEGDHDIVAMHASGIGYCFGMECPACGKLVPELAWHKYQKTGDVIVPNLKRNTFARNQSGFPKGTRYPV